MREIQATSWHGKQWIVEEGLRVGARVIVEGLHKIAPGAPVKPVPFQDPGVMTVPNAAQTKSELELMNAFAWPCSLPDENLKRQFV